MHVRVLPAPKPRSLRRLLLAIMLALLGAAANTAEAEPAAVPIDGLLEAAREQGLQVIVIQPDEAGEPAAAATPDRPGVGGRSARAGRGRLAGRFETLAAEVSAPGWPGPANNPVEPLLNGVLTVFGLAAGRLISFWTVNQHPKLTPDWRPILTSLA